RKLSCWSLRRISRTRKIVFNTRPAMMAPKKMIPNTSNPTRRQFNRIQLTFRATAAPTRHEPMVMKNAIVLARLVIRISSREIVVEKGGGASTMHSRRLPWECRRLPDAEEIESVFGLMELNLAEILS